MRLPRRALLVAPSLFLLSACQRGLEVRVEGPASAPTFTIANPARSFFGLGPHEATSLFYVVVYAPSERDANGIFSAAWALAPPRAYKGPPLRFQYGRPPRGFDEVVEAKRLKPDLHYNIEAHGPGFIGGMSFKIVGDRIVSPTT